MDQPPASAAIVPRPAVKADALGQPAQIGRSGRLPLPVWLIAAAFVVLELAVSGRYGFLQNELYFIVAGHHLAYGYVDQPPLAPLLTRVTGVLGVSPAAIRIVPALAGAAVVVMAARFAGLLGARRFGQVLAALSTAAAPLTIALAHFGMTEPLNLLAWTAVLFCVATALLRDEPRWWLGAGVAAGLGLEDNDLMVLLLIGLAAGLLLTKHRPALRTRWPWLGAGIATVIWAPNVIWQATHGWPALAMASSLHQANSTVTDYLGGLPAQLAYVGLLVIPLLIAGFVRLWRSPDLRFIAIAAALVVVYVLAWVPGKNYYSESTGPVLLAAGAVAAERWITRRRRPKLWRVVLVAAPLVCAVQTLITVLPVMPVADLRYVAGLDKTTTAWTYGWPQLTRAVAAQDAALVRSGQRPTSIFTGNYGEAGALDVLGSADHLPPVLSGHNTFWMWGPGHASDRTVLVVGALGWLRPYFADCRLLTTFYAPYGVPTDASDLPIGVCTGPVAGWPTLWPHLKHYD